MGGRRLVGLASGGRGTVKRRGSRYIFAGGKPFLRPGSPCGTEPTAGSELSREGQGLPVLAVVMGGALCPNTRPETHSRTQMPVSHTEGWAWDGKTGQFLATSWLPVGSRCPQRALGWKGLAGE